MLDDMFRKSGAKSPKGPRPGSHTGRCKLQRSNLWSSTAVRNGGQGDKTGQQALLAAPPSHAIVPPLDRKTSDLFSRLLGGRRKGDGLA
jgi:hypothetical protein